MPNTDFSEIDNLHSEWSRMEKAARLSWLSGEKARLTEKTTETIEKNNETLLATVIAIHGEVNAMTGVPENANNRQTVASIPQVNGLNNLVNQVVAAPADTLQDNANLVE